MKYLILYSLICFCGIACNTPKTAALTSDGNVKDRPSPVIENSNSHGINPKPAASNQNNLTPSQNQSGNTGAKPK